MAKARNTSARASAAAVAPATAAPAEGQTPAAQADQAATTAAPVQDAPAGVSASGEAANADPAAAATMQGDDASAEDAAAHAAMAERIGAADPGQSGQSADDVLGAVDPAEAWIDTRQGDGGAAAATAEDRVQPGGDDFQLRLTSSRAPYTRGRIRFSSKREPVILPDIGIEQFRALIADPAITVEVENIKTGKRVVIPCDAATPEWDGFAAFQAALEDASRPDEKADA